jgi:hypothetical protein
MSARDALFRDIWDMRSTEEKNALIDAYAHELAAQQRAWLDEWITDTGGIPDHLEYLTEMIGLIDPESQKP